MFLDFVSVINTIILIAIILLGRTIVENFKKEREHDLARDENFTQMIENTSSIGLSIIEIEQLIINRQKALDEKMDALARFVDAHSTNVTLQQGQLFALAKTDVESSRREELRRLKELKIALERLMGVALTSRQPPSPNDVLALENINTRIEELEEILE